MWMMGYNDAGELNFPDSFNGRRLRPLIPRPASSLTTHNPTTSNAPCLSRIHGTDLLAFNHHLAEQSKREFNTQQQQVLVSSRWNPTPEQLQTLEELYRRGTRTPSAEQIQHITAQLRRYGKIEGKNVFYWFQNHKARERQKRRRQLQSVSDEHCPDNETTERKESGANRTVFEAEQTKNWALPRNCSTLPERTASPQRAAAAAATARAAVPECRTDGWVQLEEGELHRRRSLLERNATWQMMQLSSSPPTYLLNTSTSTTVTSSSETVTTDPLLMKTSKHLNFFTPPYAYTYRQDLNYPTTTTGNGGCNYHSNEAAVGVSETLQLFPLGSATATAATVLADGYNENHNEEETETEMQFAAMNANITPYQFFEFLPLKNST